MNKMEKERKKLENNLKRTEAAHYAKSYWHSESAYQESVKGIRSIYEELFMVALELGDPIPFWM